MAVTISQIISLIDRHTGDYSTDRFTTAERYDSITESVVWLQGKHQSELQNFTYSLDFLDTINYYPLTNTLSDLLMASDLRKLEGDNHRSFAYKNDKQIKEDISNKSIEDGYTIERRDDESFLAINHYPKYKAIIISQFESLTDGGTWTLDSVTSDAENLELDQTGFYQGNACLKFDADVSNSANNRISVYATDVNSLDFTSVEGLSSFIMDIGLPSIDQFSSVTLSWGTDTSNYWSATQTTPVSGSWSIGKNTVKIDWTSATTVVGTPDVTDINYIRIDLNYTASQTDAVDYRIDYLRVARKEPLTLHYLSWNVGKDTSGNAISLFSSTTDTPYFSGKWDQLKFAIANYAAGVLFLDNRMKEEANSYFAQAYDNLSDAKDIIPSSRQRETKNFKPSGINFTRRKK